jgi:uncharacterized protein YhbP (UPF0306 family)
MTVRDAVISYLDTAAIMQIATVSGEQPWAATVFFAADNAHEIFWLSPPNARHSRELNMNDRVAATVTLPHQYGDAWQGLQVEGTVKEIDLAETEQLFQAYAERFNAHYRLPAILSGDDASRLYRLKPSLFVLYDEQNFATEPRQEWRP